MNSDFFTQGCEDCWESNQFLSYTSMSSCDMGLNLVYVNLKSKIKPKLMNKKREILC